VTTYGVYYNSCLIIAKTDAVSYTPRNCRPEHVIKL
jgi:hypothetical protein